jgi:hypothetical protein
MSEGVMHLSPPFVSTREDLEFAAEAAAQALDAMEPIIASRPAL